MSQKVDQATIIILDIGKNTSSDDKSENNFFEKAINCTKRIIERKIMSQGKDLVGILLLGSKKTRNNLAEQCPGDFKRIELFIDLETPSWKMIRDLPTAPTIAKGDWFDALIVAADFFKNCFSGYKTQNRRILLMTNFESTSKVDESQFEQVLNGFKEEDFQVDVIGYDIYSDTYKNNDVHFIRRLVDGTNGVSALFDDTMRYLVFHKKRHVNPIPWNVDLCIGPNIKIPVSSYIRIKDEHVVKSWTKAVRDPVTGSASVTEAATKKTLYMNPENKDVVKSPELIKGFHYGQELIPFLDVDKTLIYNSGPKSLTVYGFTDAKRVQWQNLNGDGLSYIFGRKGDKKAQEAVRTLVECLIESNLVGIVRRVYNNGNAPRMYVLMPVIDPNDYVCLSMAGICFKEEIKYMAFPQIEKVTCNKEQVDAFKDLIKAMDLTNAYNDDYDDNEAFPVAETISPSIQYVLDCIAFRAMNPGKPLPPPRKDIMMLFSVPELIEKNSVDIIDKLKTLFVLKKVEIKKRNKKQDVSNNDDAMDSSSKMNESIVNDLPKVDLPISSKTDKIKNIGTVDPINDYKALKDLGKPMKEIVSEMTNAIECLFHSNLDGHCARALDAMKFLRTESIVGDPSDYNNWLRNFKIELHNRNKNNIIELIKEKQLNYIIKDENSLSKYDSNDCDESQFYEMDTAPNITETDISTEVNDFFNDM
ncbi:X-ray repair cross-complementing protein 5 [Papilio machaon]|uniref:X-ray repair cross-complementing protein 5 n=1 Tax=Papilio machaon TaxID=76193 RepID=UPI001E664455|nr:X-ray repair cross-complementing protein 5 [Papilio machaon]